MRPSSQPSRSGRFAAPPAAAAASFTESVSFDQRLWRHDLVGSLAHARMLHQIGVLTRAELRAIVRGLDAIGREIAAGRFRWRSDLEDVHMNLEAALSRRTAAGDKLHTGRSRNDQVALDLRLWLREEIMGLDDEIRALQRVLVDLARRNLEVPIPGYTHLQRAQPVPVAHHLLAYVEMLARDQQRLEDCFFRLNICPLGSGALAGSTFPLDRELVARLLGFVDASGRARLTQNSMDAVADRDFAVEFCAVAALLAVHLSRLAEDLVLWSSAEFGFIEIGDAYATGSSLLPQKKNPDVAELARGKSGRMIGNLVALLALLKGLPMTYNRDLQEDKERLFDAADTVRATVRTVTAMLGQTRVRARACRAAANDPALLATDLADHLVMEGVPFRRAHRLVGAAVALAERLHKPLSQLTPTELRSVDSRLPAGARAVFDLDAALAKRSGCGAPGLREVRRQLARWQRVFAKDPRRGPRQAAGAAGWP